MTVVEADVAIVGSGVVGALIARPLLEAGLQVAMLERGGRRSHAEQLRDPGSWGDGSPGADWNHEVAPETTGWGWWDPYPWNYVYALGGSTLRWSGVAPRLAEGDFRMRSAYGVMEDWPLSYEELVPCFERAEAALAVAGGPGAAGEQPAHPFSPLDRVLEPLLDPYVPMPQARPSRPTAARPACCGAAACDVCPVDAKVTTLNALDDVLAHPRLDLRTATVAARVAREPGGRRASAIEALGADGPLTVRAPRIVLAAGGFESPALLLRSGIERPGTGEYLFDHAHRSLLVVARDPVGVGAGATIATGLSAAWLEGAFRSERSGAVVSPYNPGIALAGPVAEGLMEGRRGAALHRDVVDRWSRTIPLDILLEDVPQRARRIELSPERDAFGLPRVRIHYGAATAYEEDGWRAIRAEIEQRLAPLRPTHVEERRGPAGSHLLGTCRMATANEDGVVDRDMRHLDVENLWVAGGSAFPTYGSLHPTLTIAALAVRLGDQLAAGA